MRVHQWKSSDKKSIFVIFVLTFEPLKRCMITTNKKIIFLESFLRNSHFNNRFRIAFKAYFNFDFFFYIFFHHDRSLLSCSFTLTWLSFEYWRDTRSWNWADVLLNNMDYSWEKKFFSHTEIWAKPALRKKMKWEIKIHHECLLFFHAAFNRYFLSFFNIANMD